MTTVEPGASEVLTQGLRVRPRSIALRASRPAPTMTLGLEVLVQLVIAAMTTRPWSSSNVVPSSRVTSIASSLPRSARATAGSWIAGRGRPRSSSWSSAGGSEAGKDSSFSLVDAVAKLLAGLGVELLHRLEEGLLGVGERHPVLRALGAGDAGHDVAEVELEQVGEVGVRGVGLGEHSLLAGVGVDQLDRLGRAAGEVEVAQGLGVDREDRAGRAELRRHVAERRPVGEAQGRQARPEELDELGDDAALAQHLGHGQHQVGRGGALGQFAAELEADHLRQQHRDRLAQHRRLGLDPADAPAEHAEAVDHRRVRVGADEGVGVGLQDAVALAAVDDLGDVLEVDLVADPGRRRHDAEVVEGLAAPLEEGVALAVALELALGVDGEGAGVAKGVDLDRVVDHQVDVDQRVDRLGVAADLGHRVAHRRQVDHGGDAGEVLHQHPGGLEGDLDAGLGLGVPAGDRLDRLGGYRDAVLEPQHVLQQHLDRVGQARYVELLGQRVEAVDLVAATANVEGGSGAEGVGCCSLFHPRQPA